MIGAGGTGGLYGALLARAGHDVRFLARGAHLGALQARGLSIRGAQFGDFVVPVQASDDPGTLGPADLVVVAVKTFDLEAASEAARLALAPGGCAITLQNGVEAPDVLARAVGSEAVLVGTTMVETTILEPGVIGQLSPTHRFTISEIDAPPSPRVDALVAMFRAAGINASSTPNGRRALWEKACFLIPLAALTSVCQTSVGPIRDCPEARGLVDDVFQEVAAVARACGFDLDAVSAQARSSVETIPPTMKASMARDFERGNRTELEALCGAIVRLGQEKGVPVPVNRAIHGILAVRATSARS